ncbi:MAG: translation elongation factor Ts [Sorangiineae bacterium]|nr:translation elongation factor Ts [Polyangiaceae bacterium]MEB2325058.1 translation elongation factor Ts [Sorangiineae bacterium]
MANVNMQEVKELRDRTQAGLNDCRSALVESNGDMEKAVEIILKKGLAKSVKRAGAVATEGEVAARVTADGKRATIVEVNIQTDFAARNEDFRAFVQKVLDAAEQAKPGAELGAEPFPGGAGTVEDARAALVGRLGENITVRRFDAVAAEGAGAVASYVHMGGKIGVVLSARADRAADFAGFLNDVAMQIAAMAPLYLTKADVPEADQAKQADIFAGQLAEEGKVPEDKRGKVIEGKIAKWMKEVCLLEQESVLDSSKTIEQQRAELAKSLGVSLELTRFVRYQLGEGIEKPQGEDFAAEVAKMAGN